MTAAGQFWSKNDYTYIFSKLGCSRKLNNVIVQCSFLIFLAKFIWKEYKLYPASYLDSEVNGKEELLYNFEN